MANPSYPEDCPSPEFDPVSKCGDPETCLGVWSDSPNGREFDCEYEFSGGITCEECIFGSCGGKLDPRQPRTCQDTLSDGDMIDFLNKLRADDDIKGIIINFIWGEETSHLDIRGAVKEAIHLFRNNNTSDDDYAELKDFEEERRKGIIH